MTDRPIRKIIIHCSDTYRHMDWGREDIRRIHVEENGWSDIGYHVIIRRDGSQEIGRDLDGDGDSIEHVGAHAYGHNADSIGICLIGGKPNFNFTWAQLAELKKVVESLKVNYPEAEIIGHNSVSHKECPMFDVEAMFEYLQ